MISVSRESRASAVLQDLLPFFVDYRRRFTVKLVAILTLALSLIRPASAETVVYPRQEFVDDRRDEYPLQLLKLALKKAHSRLELKPHPVFMLQARAMREVEQRSGLDVVWTMTSRERERALLPIRIPIDRGLLGWRLLLVRSDSQARFSSISSTGQLAALRGGQGADWPDTAILSAAGFVIDASPRYRDLFEKLAAGRIDYFPRSVQEIWGELDAHRAQGFVVESALALHYPTAMYFFVSKARPDLAEEIQRGLNIALADGSFEALFMQNFRDVLDRARFGGRRVFQLENPLLPPETPLTDQRLWYSPRQR
jgi:hypothetical protein